MKAFRLLFLFAGGVLAGMGWAGSAFAQALPPGQEAEGQAVKRPPFGGLKMDFIAWNSSGLWFGGGAYRNDFGVQLIPHFSIGRRFITLRNFRGLYLQARFSFNIPVAGFMESSYTGDAPPPEGQAFCPNYYAGGVVVAGGRCDFARGPRRIDYSDINLILGNPGIYTIPKVKVHFDPLVSVLLPASAQSRMSTMVMQLLFQVNLGREFLKDRIALAYTFGFGAPFFLRSAGEIRIERTSDAAYLPYSRDVVSLGLSNFYQDPSRAGILCQPGEVCLNPSFFLQHTFRATFILIEQLSFTVLYRITNTSYRNRIECPPDQLPFDMSPPVETCMNGRRFFGNPDRFFEDFQLFFAQLSYQPLAWLGLNLSLITASPFWQYGSGRITHENDDLRAERHYRQGIFSADANAFSSLLIGFDISLDALAEKLLAKN